MLEENRKTTAFDELIGLKSSSRADLSRTNQKVGEKFDRWK
jgi:hypothetical protein